MTESFEELLGRAFDAAYEGRSDALSTGERNIPRRDFTFHMTNWLGDLDAIHAMPK